MNRCLQAEVRKVKLTLCSAKQAPASEEDKERSNGKNPLERGKNPRSFVGFLPANCAGSAIHAQVSPAKPRQGIAGQTTESEIMR